MVRRLAAWLPTGPLGHLVAGATDVTLVLGAVLRARAIRRLRERRRPSLDA